MTGQQDSQAMGRVNEVYGGKIDGMIMLGSAGGIRVSPLSLLWAESAATSSDRLRAQQDRSSPPPCTTASSSPRGGWVMLLLSHGVKSMCMHTVLQLPTGSGALRPATFQAAKDPTLATVSCSTRASEHWLRLAMLILRDSTHWELENAA